MASSELGQVAVRRATTDQLCDPHRDRCAVLRASLGSLADDSAAVDRLVAHQHAFLAVRLVMIPAAFMAWFVRDGDVAETRGRGGGTS